MLYFLRYIIVYFLICYCLHNEITVIDIFWRGNLFDEIIITLNVKSYA